MKRREIYDTFKIHLPNFTKYCIYYVILSVFLVGLSLITPLLYKKIIDDVMVNHNFQILWWICLGYVLIYLMETMLMGFKTIVVSKYINKVKFKLQRKIWKNYTNETFSKLHTIEPMDIKKRIDEDVPNFEILLNKHLLDYFILGFKIIIYVVVLLLISWKLALFTLLLTPFSLFISALLGKKIKPFYEKEYVLRTDLEHKLEGYFKYWKEIRLNNIINSKVDDFSQSWRKFGEFRTVMHNYNFMNSFVQSANNMFVTNINIYILGGILIVYDNLSIGNLLIFIMYFQVFFQNIDEFNRSRVEVNKLYPSMERLKSLIYQKKTYSTANKRFRRLTGEISFQNISFRYHASTEFVIKNMSFTIKEQEKVAIVGASGSGKSTIIKLFLGIESPQEGSVLIAGQDYTLLDPRDISKNISVVMQDPIIFNSSIKENLLIANPKSSDQEIVNACKIAQLHGFILTLPNGYETMAGESGVMLSGGQKQRLALARALLTESNILIFDEATSAIDHATETELLVAVSLIAKEKTTITIAHKLSTIVNSDRIIVVEKGEIVGEGTHKQLYGKNTTYDKLYSDLIHDEV